MHLVTRERLIEVLNYSQETGVFTWKIATNFKRQDLIGATAGVLDTHGYVKIQISGVRYYAHRLAWFYIYNEWPKYIDHINGNGADNRLCNLRPATMSQNQANSYKLERCVERHGRKYRARVKMNYTRVELGSFDTREEAQAAYHAFADKHYGEYARINREAF